MGKIDYKAVVSMALGEVGYQGESKNSKYTEFLDSISWYNYPKKNSCTWCAIFVDYLFAQNKGDLSYEQARQVVCEPADHNANSGAGCTQHKQMYVDHGRYYAHKAKGCPAEVGDQVFFKKSNGQIYHTGIVVDWDNGGIYTVEGSTDGGKVSKRYYSYSDSKLAGYGRPDYYKYDDGKTEEPKDEKPVEPSPAPVEPTPAPAPAPSQPTAKTMKVIAKRGLNVRKGAGIGYGKLYALNYGASVTVYEVKDGWGRIGDGKWVCMDYLK